MLWRYYHYWVVATNRKICQILLISRLVANSSHVQLSFSYNSSVMSYDASRVAITSRLIFDQVIILTVFVTESASRNWYVNMETRIFFVTQMSKFFDFIRVLRMINTPNFMESNQIDTINTILYFRLNMILIYFDEITSMVSCPGANNVNYGRSTTVILLPTHYTVACYVFTM